MAALSSTALTATAALAAAAALVLHGCGGGDDVPLPPIDPNATGACSQDFWDLVDGMPQGSAKGSFGDICSDCGLKAYNLFSGFQKDKFVSCLHNHVDIEDDCAMCYADSGKYGADHCKTQCLLGWCKEGCLTCTDAWAPNEEACTGRPRIEIDPCSLADEAEALWGLRSAGALRGPLKQATEVVVVASSGGDGNCDDADVSKWDGDADHAEWQNDMTTCGISCLGGAACLSSCMEGHGWSNGCAACWGELSDCTAKNCLAKCIGGRTDDCVACLKEAGCDADTFGTGSCTGFEAPTEADADAAAKEEVAVRV